MNDRRPLEAVTPMERLVRPFQEFANLEASGGILLIGCTVAALIWANSPWAGKQTYDEQSLKSIIGAEGFSAGIRYTGTFGINSLRCLQGFKDVLIDHRMQVFESTELERIEDHTALYPRGQHHGGPHHRRGGQAESRHQSAGE